MVWEIIGIVILALCAAILFMNYATQARGISKLAQIAGLSNAAVAYLPIFNATLRAKIGHTSGAKAGRIIVFKILGYLSLVLGVLYWLVFRSYFHFDRTNQIVVVVVLFVVAGMLLIGAYLFMAPQLNSGVVDAFRLKDTSVPDEDKAYLQLSSPSSQIIVMAQQPTIENLEYRYRSDAGA